MSIVVSTQAALNMSYGRLMKTSGSVLHATNRLKAPKPGPVVPTRCHKKGQRSLGSQDSNSFLDKTSEQVKISAFGSLVTRAQ